LESGAKLLKNPICMHDKSRKFLFQLIALTLVTYGIILNNC
jgi:hypothetical protein